MSGEPVTMLFTDIAESTRQLERLGDRFVELIGQHDRLVREVIAAHGGREVHTAGDSFFAVFGHAEDAVRCAEQAQFVDGVAISVLSMSRRYTEVMARSACPS